MPKHTARFQAKSDHLDAAVRLNDRFGSKYAEPVLTDMLLGHKGLDFGEKGIAHAPGITRYSAAQRTS